MSNPRTPRFTSQVSIARPNGRPRGPNHLSSGDAARAYVRATFLDPSDGDQLLHVAAVAAQSVSLPFDELRTTERALRVAKPMREALAALEALPEAFRRNEIQRSILAQVEGALRSGIFHLGDQKPQLIPEQELALEPSQEDPPRGGIAKRGKPKRADGNVLSDIEALLHVQERARAAMKKQRAVGILDLGLPHGAPEDLAEMKRALRAIKRQALLEPFYRSMNRCDVRVRFLVVLFHRISGLTTLDPLVFAAVALGAGLRGERPCEKTETEGRADAWRKAKKSAVRHHWRSPFTRARIARRVSPES
jgi:hypothetical protein